MNIPDIPFRLRRLSASSILLFLMLLMPFTGWGQEQSYEVPGPYIDTNDFLPSPKILPSGKTSCLMSITHYRQCNSIWANDLLGTCNSTVCIAGCAMASAAMLLKINGVNVNPKQLNTWLRSNGGYANGCDIDWSVAAKYPEASTSLRYVGNTSFSLSRIRSELEVGNPVIVRVDNPYGKSGGNCDHFVTVYSYSGNGTSNSDFLVADPGVSVFPTKLSDYSICSQPPLRIYQNVNGCGTTPCTPPSNDNCVDAILLTPSINCNYQTFSTNCATQSIPATSPCNGFTGGNADDDVWFRFSATAGTTYTVNLLNGTGFDGVVEIRTGSCNGSSVACDDQTGSTGVLNQVSYTPTSNQTLYVRVYHYGVGSGGGNFQICVKQSSSTCTTPGTPASATATSTGQATANLSWTPGSPSGSPVITYEWAVGTSSSVTYESGYTARGTTATFPVIATGLSCGTQYYLKVRARTSCDNSVSAYRTSAAFTTNSCGCTPPSAPTTNAATNPTQTGFRANWNSVSGAASYRLDISANSSFSSLVSGYNNLNVGNVTSYNVSGLSCNTTYYYRVRAYNNCASTNSSSRAANTSTCSSGGVMCNNDDPCSARTLTINTNGTCSGTNCSTVGATRSSNIPAFYGGTNCNAEYNADRTDDDVWFAITPANTNPVTVRVTPTSNTNNFDVVVGLYEGSCSNLTQINCADPSGNGPGVTENLVFTPVAGRTYYIRVFSYGTNSNSSGNFSICAFSSGGSSGGDCNAPTNLREDGISQTSATLRWNSVSGAVGYDVRYRRVGGGWSRWAWASSNRLNISDLQCNTEYEWEVEAECDEDYSDGVYKRFWTDICTSSSLNCNNPIALTCGQNYNGTTVGGNSNVSDYSCVSWEETGPERVHTITTTSRGTLTAKLSNLGSNDLDVFILSSCDASLCVEGEDDEAVYENAPAGTYYIVVDGYRGASGSYTLNVTGNCGAVCNPPTGLVTSSITSTSVALNWNNIPNAIDYKLQYWEVGGSTLWTQFPTSNSFNLTNLKCNTTYKWQVMSECSGSNSDYSAEREFKTAVCPCNVPDQPGAITPNTNTVCGGTTVQYSVPSVSGASYEWRYGSTLLSSTGRTVSLTPTSSGTLSVAAKNTCGTSTTRTLSITVNTKPAAPGAINGATSVCGSTPQQYSVPVVSGATSYRWTYTGGGNPAGTGRTVTFTPVNSGMLRVVAENSCGTSSAQTLSIAVADAAPARPGNISGNATVCSGTSQTYSVPAVTEAVSYQWTYTGGGNPTGTDRSISFNPTSSGTLRVIAVNACGESISRERNITVNPLPARPGVITPSASNICSGTTVTYSVSAVNGATGYVWSYSGDGNPSGTGNSISFKPTSSGTLNVAAKNSCGTSATRPLAVTVNSKPATPGAITGKTSVCKAESLTYSITAVNGADSYEWKYSGGGNPVGSTNKITLTPTSSGTLTVSAKNSCGVSAVRSLSIVVTASAPARPAAIKGENKVCIGDTKTYEVPAVAGAVTYRWTYSGNGNPVGTTNKVTLKPTSNGTLSVIATNDCGESTARELAISIGSKPTTPEAISGKSSVCNGATETYQIAAVPSAEKYTWTYSGRGNPTGVGRRITLKPTSNGVLTVVAENSCGKSSSRNLNITVKPIPDRPNTISGNTSVCSRTTQTYRITAVAGAESYSWTYSGGGNPAGTGIQATLTPTSSGTLTVTAKNSCGNSVSRALQINVTPTPTRPSLIQGAAIICRGTNQTYFVDADKNVKDYTWSYTGEGTINGIGRSITFKPTTSGTLSVFANNACGTSTVRSLRITVKDGTPTSQPGIITGETAYCSGITQRYSINPVGGAEGYLWTYSGDGNPVGEGTSITLTPTSSGVLRVVALSECGSGVARTLSLSVRALPKPPVITRKNDVLTSNYNSGNQWYYNGQPISGANGQSLAIEEKGNYSVEHTNVNGCTSMSEVMEVVSVSIDEKEIGLELFHVYPNPNEGHFTIEIQSSKKEDIILKIVNILGQTVEEHILNDLYGKRVLKSDLSKLDKGIYIINLYQGDNVISRKVMVQ